MVCYCVGVGSAVWSRILMINKKNQAKVSHVAEDGLSQVMGRDQIQVMPFHWMGWSHVSESDAISNFTSYC